MKAAEEGSTGLYGVEPGYVSVCVCVWSARTSLVYYTVLQVNRLFFSDTKARPVATDTLV